MRYIIFGDTHGNLPALEKMLKIEAGNYDELISHGDVINYGPWSNECVELLNSQANITTLRGNHEDNFLLGKYTGKHKVALAFFNFCYPQFTQFKLIKEYGEVKYLRDFRIQHTIWNNYLYPDTDLSQLEINSNYIIGHSHHQFDRNCGENRIVNTGSLGQNRKNINIANYLLLDENKNQLELKSFVFEIDIIINEMLVRNYPEICVNYYKSKSRA